jgi:hypothetical protein
MERAGRLRWLCAHMRADGEDGQTWVKDGYVDRGKDEVPSFQSCQHTQNKTSWRLRSIQATSKLRRALSTQNYKRNSFDLLSPVAGRVIRSSRTEKFTSILQLQGFRVKIRISKIDFHVENQDFKCRMMQHKYNWVKGRFHDWSSNLVSSFGGLPTNPCLTFSWIVIHSVHWMEQECKSLQDKRMIRGSPVRSSSRLRSDVATKANKQ